MQAIEQPLTQLENEDHAEPVRLSLSVELIAYAVLLLFALCVRVAELDTVPLSAMEALQTVPAWQMLHPDAPGNALNPDSPVTVWLQAVGLTMFGGSTFAARLAGLLGGMLLVMVPLLFRERLGVERTFFWTVLLVCSPIGLIAGRFSHPAIWNAVFALTAIWALWRFVDLRQRRDSLLAAASLTGLIFLSGSGGIILALIMLIAAVLTVWWVAYSQPEDLELETPGQDIISRSQAVLVAIPVQLCMMLAFLLVIIVSTGFMLHPSGLNMVGEIFAGTLSGFVQPAQPGAPFGYGLWTIFFYNPLLIVFAVITFVVLLRQERLSFFDRFLMIWAGLAALALLLYRGADFADALWFVLPVTGLMTIILRDLFINRRVFMFWLNDDLDVNDPNNPQQFAWVKFAAGTGVMVLLMMVSLHYTDVARGIQSVPYGTSFGDMIAGGYLTSYAQSAILLAMTILFMMLVFFVIAIIWGNEHAIQGYGIGLFLFMVGSGLGGGWMASVIHAEKGTEYYSLTAITSDMHYLRDTLQELADRQTRGFHTIEITVLRDETAGVTEDGVLAWALRDYENTRFVNSLEDVRAEGIVILPATYETPDLGGTYVGQSFAVRRDLPLAQMSMLDVPAWMAQRRLRPGSIPEHSIILWVRQDIFNDINPETSE